MDILLVSSSESIKFQTQKVIAGAKRLNILSFEEVKDKEILPYDIIIIRTNSRTFREWFYFGSVWSIGIGCIRFSHITDNGWVI